MVPRQTERMVMILERKILKAKRYDAALADLISEIEDKPASLIAEALREYFEQVVTSRVIFCSYFDRQTFEAFELLAGSTSGAIETALDFVDWQKLAEEIIHDSHRWDSYLRGESDD